MNRFEKTQMPKEAKIIYLDGDYHVEAPGTFVRCAVTDKVIQLDDLKYWSVARQEAYVDAEAAHKAYVAAGLKA